MRYFNSRRGPDPSSEQMPPTARLPHAAFAGPVGIAPFFLFLASTSLFAITVKGTFQYRDKEFDLNGFTGTVTDKPIRYARVEVWDVTPNPLNGQVVPVRRGVTYTDGAGSFSISGIIISRPSNIEVRCYAEADPGQGFNLAVVDPSGSPVGIANTYVDQSPSSDLDFTYEPLLALPERGGQEFNIFDNVIDTFALVRELQKRDPGVELLVVYPGPSSFYMPGERVISIYGAAPLDDDGYDDTTILHETGHFVMDVYSKSDPNAGGPHFLDQDNEDLRLAFSEAWATFWCNMVRSKIQQSPMPEAYVDTVNDGTLGFSYEVETPMYVGGLPPEMATPEFAEKNLTGSDFEIAVNAVLWDMYDRPDTVDMKPGDDDTMAIPDADERIWDVLTGAAWRMETNLTLETFWRVWFALQEGYETEMRAVFALNGVEFFPDDYEAGGDDDIRYATELKINTVQHHTFYRNGSDPRGDCDWFWFSGQAGATYTIETQNATNNGDTVLALFDGNSQRLVPTTTPSGTDPNADNPNFDDKAASSAVPGAEAWTSYADAFSSVIRFVPPQTGNYYVLCSHYSGPAKYPTRVPVAGGVDYIWDTGIGAFGAYDIKLTADGTPQGLRIDGISPSGGPPSGGTVVTIQGANFDTSTNTDGSYKLKVYFGSKVAGNVTVDESGTVIHATSPAYNATVTVDVTVVNSDGQRATYTGGFFYAQLGDVDGNGALTMADARMIAQMEAGLVPVQTWPGDVNRDGVVTIADAFLVMQVVRGKVVLR